MSELIKTWVWNGDFGGFFHLGTLFFSFFGVWFKKIFLQILKAFALLLVHWQPSFFFSNSLPPVSFPCFSSSCGAMGQMPAVARTLVQSLSPTLPSWDMLGHLRFMPYCPGSEDAVGNCGGCPQKLMTRTVRSTLAVVFWAGYHLLTQSFFH